MAALITEQHTLSRTGYNYIPSKYSARQYSTSHYFLPHFSGRFGFHFALRFFKVIVRMKNVLLWRLRTVLLQYDHTSTFYCWNSTVELKNSRKKWPCLCFQMFCFHVAKHLYPFGKGTTRVSQFSRYHETLSKISRQSRNRFDFLGSITLYLSPEHEYSSLSESTIH